LRIVTLVLDVSLQVFPLRQIHELNIILQSFKQLQNFGFSGFGGLNLSFCEVVLFESIDKRSFANLVFANTCNFVQFRMVIPFSNQFEGYFAEILGF